MPCVAAAAPDVPNAAHIIWLGVVLPIHCRHLQYNNTRSLLLLLLLWGSTGSTAAVTVAASSSAAEVFSADSQLLITIICNLPAAAVIAAHTGPENSIQTLPKCNHLTR
jgi:hypothetical protein